MKLAAPELAIVVGGGLNREAIQTLARTTASASSTWAVQRGIMARSAGPVDATEVRELASVLEG